MHMQHYLYPRITVDDTICFGKPCIRNMRMPVASILAYLSGGMSTSDLLREFPILEQEDISQALAYSASMLDEQFLPLEKVA
jgi:uncharacterized protein (DUF433 family)